MYLHFISRKIAKERGLVHFFMFEKCKNGHLSERNTKSSTCLTCDKEKKTKYRADSPEKTRLSLRKSRIKHLEQRKKDNKIWREKNKEHLKVSKKEYVEKNRELVSRKKREYYEKNKEKVKAQKKISVSKKPDYYKELAKKWREKNHGKVIASNRNRKSMLRKAEGNHSNLDIANLLLKQRNHCAGCFKKIKGNNYHVDHIQPLVLGGSNWPSNLQILCPYCNCSKGGKSPENFYQSRGFLL